MVWLQLLVVLAAIFLGARLGGIGIGFAAGLGVVGLALLGAPVTTAGIPWDVVTIIMSVIAAIAAMQVAGGMDYLVSLAENILRSNPRMLSLLAPLVTYTMTLMAGTGHTAFSTMPVIVEVAKETNLRPRRPLSVAVVASQIAITASPISAAVVFFAAEMGKKGVDYVQLLSVVIPSTLLAVILGSVTMMAVDKARGVEALDADPVYQQRLADGLVKPPTGVVLREFRPGAKRSVLVFLIGLLGVMFYATAISETVRLIPNPPMDRNSAIIAIMLSVAAVITMTCRIPLGEVTAASTFRAGMSASICVLGVAWLGTTFVNAHSKEIQQLAGDTLKTQPWLLAVVLFFAACLLYSQAATTKAIMPIALALGVAPVSAVASFAAVSALFVLPTYPTLLAAVEMDDTGTTRIGKYVFNHPFLVPGVVFIGYAVLLGFLIGSFVL